MQPLESLGYIDAQPFFETRQRYFCFGTLQTNTFESLAYASLAMEEGNPLLSSRQSSPHALFVPSPSLAMEEGNPLLSSRLPSPHALFVPSPSSRQGVYLEPGQSAVLKFTLPAAMNLSTVADNGDRFLAAGTYKVELSRGHGKTRRTIVQPVYC
jgi:hypothetical protein